MTIPTTATHTSSYLADIISIYDRPVPHIYIIVVINNFIYNFIDGYEVEKMKKTIQTWAAVFSKR